MSIIKKIAKVIKKKVFQDSIKLIEIDNTKVIIKTQKISFLLIILFLNKSFFIKLIIKIDNFDVLFI